MKRLTFIAIISIAMVYSNCAKKSSDCFEDPNAKIKLYVNAFKAEQKYPQLPTDNYVLGSITNVGHYSVDNIYGLTNKQYSINGTQLTSPNTPTGMQIGQNILSLKADCIAKNKDLQFTCNCPDSMKVANKTFTVIDTMRIWIKKITHSKDYPPVFGFRKDIYMVINNFKLISPVWRSYNRAVDGDMVWNIDDTVTISAQYFNMSISTWDADQIGKNEKQLDFFITAADVNNWATGTQNFYKNGGFVFEIVRL